MTASGEGELAVTVTFKREAPNEMLLHKSTFGQMGDFREEGLDEGLSTIFKLKILIMWLISIFWWTSLARIALLYVTCLLGLYLHWCQYSMRKELYLSHWAVIFKQISFVVFSWNKCWQLRHTHQVHSCTWYIIILTFRGVFDWPLVFFKCLHVFDKNGQNDSEGVGLNQKKARFGLSRVNYPYVGYLFDKICKFWNF